MCSTTTIIYIVIAFIVLIFIYNYMKKKSEGLETGSLTKLSIPKCTTSKDIDISNELIKLENKIKSSDKNINVKLSKINNYIIEFIIKLPPPFQVDKLPLKLELSPDLSKLITIFEGKPVNNLNINKEINDLKSKLEPEWTLQRYLDFNPKTYHKIMIVKK